MTVTVTYPDIHSWIRLKYLCRANGRGGFRSQTAADTPRKPLKTRLRLRKHFRVLSIPALQRETAWDEERFFLWPPAACPPTLPRPFTHYRKYFRYKRGQLNPLFSAILIVVKVWVLMKGSAWEMSPKASPKATTCAWSPGANATWWQMSRSARFRIYLATGNLYVTLTIFLELISTLHCILFNADIFRRK